MKRSQQVIIGIGFLVVAAMCIVPPFRFHRTSEYLPVWTNTVGKVDMTRLCLQIGAVAILTSGLVFLAKGEWKRGNEGEVVPWRKLTAIAASVVIIAAIIACDMVSIIGKEKAEKAERDRALPFLSLSKVKLEPLEIWGDRYLKYRLYNGTDRAVNELQVTLYISKTSEPIGRVGADGRRYITEDEAFGSSPRIKLTMVKYDEFPPCALSAREYKQDFSTIGAVPPNSWSEGSIRLSNCPEVEDGARWLVLLKAAKWTWEKGSN